MGFLSSLSKLSPSQSLFGKITGESKDAAQAQVQQAQETVALRKEMFNRIRESAEPLRELRNQALPDLLRTQGIGQAVDRSQFYNSPEYRQTYGAAAGVANNLPGNAPTGLRNALLARAGNLAGGEYGNFYNRLANIGGFSSKGLGSTNAQLQGNINAQTQLLSDAGAAAASGLIGSANQRGQAAGAIGGLLGAFLSDQRTKEDIEHVGVDSEGNNVYEYSYKQETKPKYIGYMAQEVAAKDPANALLHNGLLMVSEKYKPVRIS